MLGCFLTAFAAYGLLDASQSSLWAITLVISLMHFWYDGFVGSVRRSEM